MLIHHVQSADLPDLSRLARDTFIHTFGHLYPAADLNAYLDKAYAPDVLAEEIDGEDQFWRIVRNDMGRAVAYIQVGPVSLPHMDARPETQGEIKRLYVHHDAQGAGLGKQLLEIGLAFLKARYGDAPQWIGVWSENHRAQKLYGSYGFKRVGDYGFKVGGTTDFEFILRRSF
ncbi:GNAT family N-acetyltransferase [Asticcacaulis sp. AND118]|uniref:GNAT family N-acetyltransferase n=1 Tax=Asticcacaulis sp. AND118 TaxID=2840468 RepID=UPI001D000AF1|nr:N-acetyltransferase [Asticcacaulis sp. AND118]UDF04398.1 GNAT family N-acetyltransferase [Asticcacaulis sp. AND118]